MENVNLLVDAKNFCFRAGVVEDLTNKKGEPVYLLYVGLKMLRKLVYDYKPKRVIMLWDGGRSKWRIKNYPEYKHRSNSSGLERYDEIISQIDIFRKIILPMFPVYQWIKKGREADDLINAAVRGLYKKGGRSVIVSTDKDFYQLLHFADIYRPAKEDMYTEKDFEKEYGFSATGWTSYRAMTGDSSDNIKGMDGIGKVTARKIMIEHSGSIEEFYQSNPEGKIQKRAHSTDQLEIRARNEALMDFELYPYRDTLRKEFDTVLSLGPTILRVDDIKDYLFNNQFLSILKSYRAWIRPFERMV